MIRVVVADDELLVRAGLRMILEAMDDIVIVAEARDGAEAVTKVSTHQPDVVLMDVRMPNVDGLTATSRIVRSGSSTRIIMLTTFDLDEYVHEALRAGAVGFLLKDTPPHDIAAAVRVVAAGNAMLSPTVTKRLIASFTLRGPSRMENARKQLKALTRRELDVIRAVACGLSNAQIAKDLILSEPTVKAHVSSALAKLGLNNRVQAAILAHDANLEELREF